MGGPHNNPKYPQATITSYPWEFAASPFRIARKLYYVGNAR